MAFAQLGLSDRLVQGILATGYTAPTEIQARAIPIALAGKDIIGSAQTGTGKTAAFVLPILHRLEHAPVSHGHHRHPRALILTPTRELAQQIEDAAKGYGRFLSLKMLSIYGGANMSNQIKSLHRGVDIVIATPGRLLDLLERRAIDLSKVTELVLDEADRMFDMGFIQDVRTIIGKIPGPRHTMMFSATMPKQIRDLMATVQIHPVLIEIGERQSPVDSVRQAFYSINQDRKIELLLFMLQSKELDSVLVFSRTKHGADKISTKLTRANVKAVAIHSDRTQAQRERALAGFKQGQHRVLVATDVAARGIDVNDISHVINYDIPNFPEDYIHRIGRTGRASKTGDAITFISKDDHQHLKRLERFINKRFELKRYPGFDYDKPAEHAPARTPHAGPSHKSHPPRHEQRERPDQRHQRPGQKPAQKPHQREELPAPLKRGERPRNARPGRDQRREPFRKKTPTEARIPNSALEGQKTTGDWRSLVASMEDRIKKVKKKFRKP